MMPHVFETIINGKLYRHYSLESAVKTLLEDTAEDHWFWNLLRQSIKNLSVGERYSLFNGSCSVKRVGYAPEEIKYVFRIEKGDDNADH